MGYGRVMSLGIAATQEFKSWCGEFCGERDPAPVWYLTENLLQVQPLWDCNNTNAANK